MNREDDLVNLMKALLAKRKCSFCGDDSARLAWLNCQHMVCESCFYNCINNSNRCKCPNQPNRVDTKDSDTMTCDLCKCPYQPDTLEFWK